MVARASSSLVRGGQSPLNAGVSKGENLNKSVRFKEILPELCSKIQKRLVEEEEGNIAAELEHVNIYFRCECEREYCSSFWTARDIDDPRGEERYRSVWVRFDDNECILDVVKEHVVYIEFERNIEWVATILRGTHLEKKPYFVGKG